MYVIGARPNSLTSRSSPGATVITARTAICTTSKSLTVQIVYGNWHGLNTESASRGEIPNSNAVIVQASLQKMGTSSTDQTPHRVPVTFAGNSTGICSPNGLLFSDPINFAVGAGETFFIYTCVNTNLPSGPTSPPVLSTATTGGNLTAGTYQVLTTYVYPDYESIGSQTGSVTTTGTTSTINVTAPAMVAGASGYRVYVAPVNTTVSSIQDALLVSGTIPFTNNFTCKVPPSATALTANVTAYFSYGIYSCGGTVNYGVGNGEGASPGNYCADGTGNVAQNVAPCYSPVAVLGDCYGVPPASIGLIGDSIMAGTGDTGYLLDSGGFGVRSLTNQSSLAYVQGTLPSFAFVDVAQGGEQAIQYANPTLSTLRRELTSLCSIVLSDYGTNDLALGSASIVNSLLTIAGNYTNLKIPFFQTTLPPKTSSRDGWQTVANQSVSSVIAEGYRRAVNNWLRDGVHAAMILNETPYGGYTAGTPTTNFYAGGNGVAVSFITAYPFTEGTELVKVNGVTQLLGTKYSYLTTAGTTASGIKFAKAPANGATITITYRKIPGFTASAGPLATVFDTASAVEVTPANVLTNDSRSGGFWRQPPVGAVLVGTATDGTLTSITDSTQVWTANQYKGYNALVTSGLAAGQGGGIYYTTAVGFMDLTGMSVSPAAGDSYMIYDRVTLDGVHPSSRGHVLMSTKIDTTKFK
jgi:hypothetical protein